MRSTLITIATFFLAACAYGQSEFTPSTSNMGVTDGVTHPANVSNKLSIGGTDSDAPFYFDPATGMFTINTVGGGISVAPSLTSGSSLVLDEALDESSDYDAGAGTGTPNTFTLKVNDAGLASDLTCTVNSDGTWSGDCPSGSNITYGEFHPEYPDGTNEDTGDEYFKVSASGQVGTASVDVTVTPENYDSGANFTINTTGTYRIDTSHKNGGNEFLGSDTSGCFYIQLYQDDVLFLANLNYSSQTMELLDGNEEGIPMRPARSSNSDQYYIGDFTAGDELVFYLSHCITAVGRLKYGRGFGSVNVSHWTIERLQ